MVAGDDPLIGIGGAVDGADDVPDGAIGVVLLEQEMDLHPAGAGVVRERQTALPFLRDDRASERLEDRLGVVPGDWGGWNCWLASSLVRGDALVRGKIRIGGGSRSGGVTRIFKNVLHRAALYSGCRTIGAFGVDLAFGESVVGGVAIDDDAGRAAKLREVDLHATEVVAVAHEDDLALDVDVQVFELLEVFGGAVVRIDDFGREIAGGRRTVKGGDDARVILVRIVGNVFGSRPGHQYCAVGRGGGDLHLFGDV